MDQEQTTKPQQLQQPQPLHPSAQPHPPAQPLHPPSVQLCEAARAWAEHKFRKDFPHHPFSTARPAVADALYEEFYRRLLAAARIMASIGEAYQGRFTSETSMLFNPYPPNKALFTLADCLQALDLLAPEPKKPPTQPKPPSPQLLPEKAQPQTQPKPHKFQRVDKKLRNPNNDPFEVTLRIIPECADLLESRDVWEWLATMINGNPLVGSARIMSVVDVSFSDALNDLAEPPSGPPAPPRKAPSPAPAPPPTSIPQDATHYESRPLDLAALRIDISNLINTTYEIYGLKSTREQRSVIVGSFLRIIETLRR